MRRRERERESDRERERERGRKRGRGRERCAVYGVPYRVHLTILKLICWVCSTNPSTLEQKEHSHTRWVGPHRLFCRDVLELTASSFCDNIFSSKFLWNCTRSWNFSPLEDKTGRPIPGSVLEGLKYFHLDPRPESRRGPLKCSAFTPELIPAMQSARKWNQWNQLKSWFQRWNQSCPW